MHALWLASLVARIQGLRVVGKATADHQALHDVAAVALNAVCCR